MNASIFQTLCFKKIIGVDTVTVGALLFFSFIGLVLLWVSPTYTIWQQVMCITTQPKIIPDRHTIYLFPVTFSKAVPCSSSQNNNVNSFCFRLQIQFNPVRSGPVLCVTGAIDAINVWAKWMHCCAFGLWMEFVYNNNKGNTRQIL